MRLLKRASHPDGSVEVKVSVASIEDLWHLYNMILPGDTVCTRTRRKITNETAMGSQKADVVTLTLKISVKQIDFTPDEIRLQGQNVGENAYVKMGAHHTLTIHSHPPQEVTVIKKTWDSVLEERLKDACQPEARADTAAVLMDFGVAQIILVTPSIMHVKAKVEVSIAKKHKNDGTARDKSINRFFQNVLNAITSHIDIQAVKLLLICSPGHVREEFMEFVKQACMRATEGPLRTLQSNFSKVMLVKVHSNTIGGLREAFSDPAVSHKMQATRSSSDSVVWDRFQSTMNSNPDLCVYTPQFVYHAAIAGAISSLMISDAVFRSPEPIERRFFLSLYHFVKNTGAEVSVFSSHHVTGEQLIQLGNVAAVLYFAIPELDEMDVVEDFVQGKEVADFVRDNAVSSVTV